MRAYNSITLDYHTILASLSLPHFCKKSCKLTVFVWKDDEFEKHRERRLFSEARCRRQGHLCKLILNNPESTALLLTSLVSTPSSEDVNSFCLLSAAFVWTQMKYCKVFKTSFVFYHDKRRSPILTSSEIAPLFPALRRMLLTALPDYVIFFLDSVLFWM